MLTLFIIINQTSHLHHLDAHNLPQIDDLSAVQWYITAKNLQNYY